MFQSSLLHANLHFSNLIHQIDTMVKRLMAKRCKIINKLNSQVLSLIVNRLNFHSIRYYFILSCRYSILHSDLERFVKCSNWRAKGQSLSEIIRENRSTEYAKYREISEVECLFIKGIVQFLYHHKIGIFAILITRVCQEMISIPTWLPFL